MLDREQKRYIFERSYVPEHVPEYVQAITGAEPFLDRGYLCYVRDHYGIFVGYPLAESSGLSEVVSNFQARFKLAELVVIAEDVRCLSGIQIDYQGIDCYYVLPIPLSCIAKKNTYMVRRASRELSISDGVYGPEHELLVKTFCEEHALSSDQRYIFSNLGAYTKASSTARLIEARKLNKLVAFNIIEEGSLQHLFYMFHVRDRQNMVPGSSDLLFLNMVKRAEALGKKRINLGLGMTEGVRQFKEKWGARPSLKHSIGTLGNKRAGRWRSFVDSLLRIGSA